MTLSTDSGMEVVSPSDVVVIAQDVWASFLDLQLDPVPSDITARDGQLSMVGVVHVSEAWRGVVLLECSDAMARHVAATMFASEVSTLTDAEVVDALGELTNMIGGNIKSLLPAPSRLSLPAVGPGVWPTTVPDAAAVSRVMFVASSGEPVQISVWQS